MKRSILFSIFLEIICSSLYSGPENSLCAKVFNFNDISFVVKILLKNPSLNPLQLTAAGRADFVPIESNKTASGRSANRRIEMILSPNLDDLFKLLNN